ncbi:hypothetical protein [Prosthecomicrobium pneumaticum]|uniref:Uncharacterized protein n=1 Tax=Prosthecomicrobium pneumaticum TaxID=81895 RepID=A0A7W9FKR5_9HYPH|nr:hypothetical protein [Prosthecomicrobium pneumaticum]MBB5751378.1 hypothetical protein [Prosthecomicrobium pneumaticum]
MAGVVEVVENISVGGARVRVVTDCARDVGFLVDAEKTVVARLTERGLWPHAAVTLIVLDELASLVGPLKALGRLPEAALLQLPQRPMVNLYDPRSPAECFIFVNRRIMTDEGCWGDARAATGLLAHEHAHPLSEAPATAAARTLQVRVEAPPVLIEPALHLARTLSTGAVTELLANTFCLKQGFGEAIGHLDRLTLGRALANLPQRAELERRASAAVAAGSLARAVARPLLLIADAQIGLPFALEIAPFARAGAPDEAMALEAVLSAGLLAAMPPEVGEIYGELRRAFERVQPEWDTRAIEAWCTEILAQLCAFLSDGGAAIRFSLEPAAMAGPEGRQS